MAGAFNITKYLFDDFFELFTRNDHIVYNFYHTINSISFRYVGDLSHFAPVVLRGLDIKIGFAQSSPSL